MALVHHETTTGLLNPVREVGQVVQAAHRVFLVDSISGLAGDDIDLETDAIDICVGTANKSIQGLPGMSFVLVNDAGFGVAGNDAVTALAGQDSQLYAGTINPITGFEVWRRVSSLLELAPGLLGALSDYLHPYQLYFACRITPCSTS